MTRKSQGTHWISFSIEKNTAVYFDSFGIEYIPQNVLKKKSKINLVVCYGATKHTLRPQP